MTDVSMLGALLAGLVSFLSPCVLPLVPGYVSMLSGIGMEQLRQGQQPRAGLFGSALSFVLGFSTVFITFGASASAVGQFLRQNRGLLAPIAGALILLFGLHLIGWLAKLSFRVGAGIGILFVLLGFFAALQSGPGSRSPLGGRRASARSWRPSSLSPPRAALWPAVCSSSRPTRPGSLSRSC